MDDETKFMWIFITIVTITLGMVILMVVTNPMTILLVIMFIVIGLIMWANSIADRIEKKENEK